MRIALINGSPKVKESASGGIIEELKGIIDKSNGRDNRRDKEGEIVVDCVLCDLHVSYINDEQKDELYNCDALIFVFPLYVDGVPSHLLHCLKELQVFFNKRVKKPIRVYAVVNCGFYEGKQNENAIEILKNWSLRAGLLWGQGIGIGGGGMLSSLKNVPEGNGLKKNLGKAYTEFISNVQKGESGDHLFVNPNFPRFAYIMGAHFGWKSQIKANGLEVKDLDRRL